MPRSSRLLAVAATLAALVVVAGVALHSVSPARAAAAYPVFPPAAKAPPSPDGIPFASPHAAAVSTPSAAQAWGGERTGSEATLSDRVVSYQIKARLDPAQHTVEGQERLTWRNRSDREVRAVYLHLYLNAFEGAESTFYGEENKLHFSFRSDVETRDGEWGHIELDRVTQSGTVVPWYFVHPDLGPDTDHTVVRLDLPQPVPAGGSATLEIGFHDQLPRVVARTGYFGTFHLVAQWFPKIGVLELPGERGAEQVQWNVHEFHLHSEFYADYGEFDVTLSVPPDYTVGAVGVQQGPARDADGLRTTVFHQADVHDFAWTADSRSAPPLEGQYVGLDGRHVKVKVLFPPEYKQCAPAVLQASLDSLGWFSRTLGAYPYDTVTAVIPPFNAGEAGGMEYPTFFTADGCDEAETGTLDRGALDFVTIHEFGHGYFYGILGSNEFEEPMLDEGLNQYWDMRMLRARKQPLDVATPWSKRLGLGAQLPWFDVDRLGAMRSRPTDKLGGNSWDRASSTGYASVYSRTSTAMRDLETALGSDVMERCFKAYYARWKFRHPSIADLRATLEEVSGQPQLVERMFAEQVYSANAIDDRIGTFSSEEDEPLPGTGLIQGKWVERTSDEAEKEAKRIRAAWDTAHPDPKPGTGPFPFRTVLVLRHYGIAVAQDVVVHFSDGSVEKFVWNDPERWERRMWVKPVKATSVEIDPDGKHALNASVIAQTRSLEPDGSASRHLAGNVDALVHTLFSLVMDL